MVIPRRPALLLAALSLAAGDDVQLQVFSDGQVQEGRAHIEMDGSSFMQLHSIVARDAGVSVPTAAPVPVELLKPSCTVQRQPQGGAAGGPIVLTIGDSLTECRDAPCADPTLKGKCISDSWIPGGRNTPWPSALQALLPAYRVLNRGCYGQTVEQIAARLEQDIPPEVRDRVAVTTVMAGTNNLWKDVGQTTEQVTGQLAQLHAQIRGIVPRAKLAVMALPPGGPDGTEKDEVNKWLEATYSNRASESIYFVDTRGLPETGNDPDGHPWTYDGTHFGPKANQMIAELVKGTVPFELAKM